jgi:hypothetical protein
MRNLAIAELRTWFVVLHGFNKRRCPAKRGKFVLLFPNDPHANTIKLFRGEKLPPGTIGDPEEDQPAPSLKGDAILIVDADEVGIALYWDGERYRWYPYNGEAVSPVQAFHAE